MEQWDAYLDGEKIAEGATEVAAMKNAIVAYEMRFLPSGALPWSARLGRGALIDALTITRNHE